MKIIEEIADVNFPFKWVRLDAFRETEAYRNEIYLKEDQDINIGLEGLFYDLFEKSQYEILIFNDSWWDFTLDTWNIAEDTYDYNIKGKPEETVNYLNMLSESGIPKDYSGSCRCLNWKNFLQIVLPCITTHVAPYSPIFYNKQEGFFFYFHHTGSIGIYFREFNTAITELLAKASRKYRVVE